MFNGMLMAAAADAGSFDVASIMSQAVETVKGDLLGVLAVVVPAIAIVVGAVVGVKFGIKWLKSLKG